jgi:gliding motility-associated-like protein
MFKIKKQLLLVFLLFSYTITAQIDTEFWFAAPEVSSSSGQVPIKLRFLSYSTSSAITVSQPANVAFVPITINLAANSIDSINLSSFITSIEPGVSTLNNNGLKIVASTPISCYYDLQAPGNKEYFTLKGKKGIGTDFYTPFPTFWNNISSAIKNISSIEVVATLDNTTILVTPRTNIIGAIANATFPVTLNKGQTYSARDTSILGTTTLAGSIISADKPVAVTVYYGGAVQSGCIDAMGDQITTSAYAGRDYIIQKQGGVNERVYVLATQNLTSIQVTNSSTTSTVINWSETYEVALTDQITYIKTSLPSYVIHVSGNGCELSLAQVPNAFCAGTYESVFSRTSSDSLNIVVHTRTGFEDNFTLNGNPALIPASAFQTVPGTGGEFKVAKIYFTTAQVPVGSYNKVVNTDDIFGLAFQNGAMTRGSAFGYTSSFDSNPFTIASNLNTAAICANTDISLAGQIGGGSVTGIWSTTGFGAFQSSTNTLANLYNASDLDTIISPIYLILSSTGPCPVKRDSISLTVNPSPIVNAGQDQVVCANNRNVTLVGTVQGGASTGSWTTSGSGTFTPSSSSLSSIYSPSAADSAAGNFALYLSSTSNGSCFVEKDTMLVSLTPAPIVNAGPASLNVCANNPNVVLAGTVSGSSTTGKWITTGTGIFIPNNQNLNATYTPGVLDVSSGAVTIYLESTNNGACLKVRDSILLTFTGNPMVNAGANIVQCSNLSTINLSGSVSGPTSTGVWSGGSGVFGSTTALTTSYTASIAEQNAGTVVLTLTSSNNQNCTAVADVIQINFIAAPVANFNKTDVCFGTATNFTDASVAGFGTVVSWNWNFGDNTIAAAEDTTHTFITTGTQTIQLIVTNSSGCIDTVSKTAVIFTKPLADFTYTSACPNDNIILSFTDNSISPGNPITNFLYDFGGQGIVAQANTNQLFAGAGNYNILHIVSTINGCADTIVKLINIPEKPVAGFEYNFNNNSGIGVLYNFIDTSSFATSYFYTFGDGNTATDQNPNNTYFANGSYSINQTVSNAIGCIDSTSALITINKVSVDIKELIPNAISPNDDGENDVWKLGFINLLYKEASVKVFNSWGQEVFSSVGYKEFWNGTYKGEILPDGTYFYVIDLNAGKEDEIYKGTLLIFKNKN